ncbi:sporulation membrane protein YtaF [Halalkalibacillus sediminis]|uniref:sporulation membrane protein YtaF n=1 Tax=Halalkalibacillus sediminis TaxID=2018042 RepID=UPI0013905A63|nr:sporulation membrane protein YtaF [Halalkalibacillus sediminis]
MEELIIVLILLSFAVSFDSYFFGLTYSLRSIHVGGSTYGIIGLMTGLSFILGYSMGDLIETILPHVSRYIGSVIFVVIGCMILKQWLQEQKTKWKQYTLSKGQQWNLKMIWLILKQPHKADVDHSGSITGKESFFVATALSMDSLGSGIGVGFTELPFMVAASMIGISSMFFLALGNQTGKWIRSVSWVQPLSFLPGIIFIFIGIWNFIK